MPTSTRSLTNPIHFKDWKPVAQPFRWFVPPQYRPNQGKLVVPTNCIVRDSVTHAPAGTWRKPPVESPHSSETFSSETFSSETCSTAKQIKLAMEGVSLRTNEQRPYHRPKMVREAITLHDEEKQATLMTTLEAILATGYPFLGGGVYGAAYSCGPDWAIKIARNDGTRQYLEWCLAMQHQGKGMKGMPQIEFVSSVTSRVMYSGEMVSNYYAVGMRRYRPARGRLREFGVKVYDTHPLDIGCCPVPRPEAEQVEGLGKFFFEPIYSINLREGCPKYIKTLVDATEAEFGGGYANDVHSGNLMYETDQHGERTLILTDPSSRNYPFLATRHLAESFELTPC